MIEILNATTGATEKVLSEQAAPSPIRWSPNGHRATFEKASPHSITDVPLLYDIDASREIPVGPSINVTIGSMEWDADGKTLTGSAIEGTSDIFLKIDASSGAATKVTELPVQAAGWVCLRGAKISINGRTCGSRRSIRMKFTFRPMGRRKF